MNKQILHIALPSIVSNITVPLLGLVDVAITGHMGDAHYMAAIAVGSMIFNITYWLFAFLRFGTGGMTAQAYGAAYTEGATGDKLEVCRILMQSQLTCLLCSLSLVLLQWPVFQLAMWFLSPGEDIIGLVRTYYYILIWGTVPSLAMYAFNGWFVGMQNTKIPMCVSITQNIVNILVSLCLVYVFHMKIEGVALGTLAAQWCGVFMALLLLRLKYRHILQGAKWSGMVKLSDLKRFFAVNRILFYRTLFLVAVNLYVIEAGARSGADILAVNSVLMQLFILYTYVMDGFAFAAEALCGKFYGALDAINFRLALRGVWRWALALTTAYTLLYIVGSDTFLSLLTNDDTIRTVAKPYLPWAWAIPFCGVAAFVWDGVFVGLTETKGMMWGTMSGAIAFFIIYITLFPLMHNHALWLAFNAYLFMRGVAQWVIWKRKTPAFLCN